MPLGEPGFMSILSIFPLISKNDPDQGASTYIWKEPKKALYCLHTAILRP